MTNYSDVPFKRNAVQPMKCLSDGFDLIKDRYWFFLGMCFVAIVVSSAVPFGILLGPMMCGLYMTFFMKRLGQPIEFGTLFKGFDHFGQSVIATLFHIIPVMIIVIPAYILFYVGFVVAIAASGNTNEPNPAALFGVIGFAVLFWLAIVIVLIFISILFTFSYPLIVDRHLQCVDALKLSARAGMANFWKLLWLLLMTGLLQFLGVLLCYVGVLFVFPVAYAALAVAYEQVFGISNAPLKPNVPPPPPVFS